MRCRASWGRGARRAKLASSARGSRAGQRMPASRQESRAVGREGSSSARQGQWHRRQHQAGRAPLSTTSCARHCTRPQAAGQDQAHHPKHPWRAPPRPPPARAPGFRTACSSVRWGSGLAPWAGHRSGRRASWAWLPRGRALLPGPRRPVCLHKRRGRACGGAWGTQVSRQEVVHSARGPTPVTSWQAGCVRQGQRQTLHNKQKKRNSAPGTILHAPACIPPHLRWP